MDNYADLFEDNSASDIKEALEDGLKNTFHQQYNPDYIDWCKQLLLNMEV